MDISPQEANNRDIVQVYHKAALRTYDSGALLPEGVILMAVLVGGDYDEVRHIHTPLVSF